MQISTSEIILGRFSRGSALTRSDRKRNDVWRELRTRRGDPASRPCLHMSQQDISLVVYIFRRFCFYFGMWRISALVYLNKTSRLNQKLNMLQPQMSHASNNWSRLDFMDIFMPLLIVILSALQMYTVAVMSLKTA